MAAFKGAGTTGDVTPPTVPGTLTATATSSSQINLGWTASTDNVGVTGYRVESCQGVSCSTFAQISSPTALTYSATGLAASSSYSFRVRATDAAGNLGPYSNIATTSTQSAADTSPPTAPTALTATATSTSQINLNWMASTDNVGVTGYRVESCQGVSCTTFTQIGTPTTTTYSATGLTASTSYTFRVRATDAAGNLGGYSGTASTTTQSVPDTSAPIAPTALTATTVSSSQINLSWTASTDNVGVTGYRVERCQGTSCTTFAQIGSPISTSYSDTGLTASTSYSYQVRATDAAGNLSGYSGIATRRHRVPDRGPSDGGNLMKVPERVQADSSGNANTATLLNTPTWTTGRVGPNALSFGGTSADVGASGSGTLANLCSTGLTVSAWIKPTGSGGGGLGRIVDKDNNDGGWFFAMMAPPKSSSPRIKTRVVSPPWPRTHRLRPSPSTRGNTYS